MEKYIMPAGVVNFWADFSPDPIAKLPVSRATRLTGAARRACAPPEAGKSQRGSCGVLQSPLVVDSPVFFLKFHEKYGLATMA